MPHRRRADRREASRLGAVDVVLSEASVRARRTDASPKSHALKQRAIATRVFRQRTPGVCSPCLTSREQTPSPAPLVGLSRFFAAAARQVRPYWKGMTLVVMASVPQVALETVQPMLLMVLINAIVQQNTHRVWMAVLGLIGLIPIYIAGNFLFEYMAAQVGAEVSNDLRIAAFWRLQALSVGYHRGRSRGDLLSVSARTSTRSNAVWSPSSRSRCPVC